MSLASSLVLLAMVEGFLGAGFRATLSSVGFQVITGMSPHQEELRLQEARSLLRNDRKDVATVRLLPGPIAAPESASSQSQHRRLPVNLASETRCGTRELLS